MRQYIYMCVCDVCLGKLHINATGSLVAFGGSLLVFYIPMWADLNFETKHKEEEQRQKKEGDKQHGKYGCFLN